MNQLEVELGLMERSLESLETVRDNVEAEVSRSSCQLSDMDHLVERITREERRCQVCGCHISHNPSNVEFYFYINRMKKGMNNKHIKATKRLGCSENPLAFIISLACISSNDSLQLRKDFIKHQICMILSYASSSQTHSV